MPAVFHTPLANGAAANVATVNNPLLELDTKMQVSLDADGTLKAGAVDGTTILADGIVTAAKLAAAVAGDGLAGGAGTALSVNTDDITIEKSSDALRVKAGGIGPTHLAADSVGTAAIAPDAVTASEIAAGAVGTTELALLSVTGPKLAGGMFAAGLNLIFDPRNAQAIPVGRDFGGRSRWHNSTNGSIVDDATNPFGTGKTLRFPGAGGTQFGKWIWADESGLQPGDVITSTVVTKAASGTWSYNLQAFTAAGATVGSASSVTITADGTVQTSTTASLTIPATTAYIKAYFTRTVGSIDLDIYNMQATKGDYVSGFALSAAPELFSLSQPQQNLIFDPFNSDASIIWQTWGGRRRWYHNGATTDASIIVGDAANPYPGGNTLRTNAGGGGRVGKDVWLDEVGMVVGDTFTVAWQVYAASSVNVTTHIGFWTAAGALIGSNTNSTATNVNNTSAVIQISAVIPATAAYMLTYITRSASVAIDTYAIWGNRGKAVGPMATPATAPTYAIRAAVESMPNLAQVNEAGLAGWHAKIAWIQARTAAWKLTWTDSTTKQQAHICCIGDSWFQRRNIVAPLRLLTQADYGDAGIGFVSANSGHSGVNYRDRYTQTRTGTWTDVDANIGGGVIDYTALGIDLQHALSTDIATPAQLTVVETGTAVSNTIFIHIVKQTNGGSFQYRVDGAAWSADISTANAGFLFATQTVAVSATAAAHTVDVKVTVAGPAGVILAGVSFWNTDIDGVVIHKLGNGSSAAADWAGVDATVWQAGLAALTPDLVAVLLGTNDRTLDVTPASYGANLALLVDRIRVATPLADILLISPAATGDTSSPAYTMDLYDQEMRAVAVRKGCAFWSGYAFMNPYLSNKARHLMTPDTGAADAITGEAADNGRHASDIGGQLIANALYKLLRVS